MRFARRLLPCLPCLLVLSSASLPAARMIIQRSPLAGFTHHAAPEVWARLSEGDRVELALDSRNPHDSQAVQVHWQGRLLGYLPRQDNGALARALHQGLPLEARISRLRPHPDPRQRIEIEVSALAAHGG